MELLLLLSGVLCVCVCVCVCVCKYANMKKEKTRYSKNNFIYN